MKKIFAVLAAVALVAFGTAAFAADTATVTVTATVQGACAFQSTTATLAFGLLPVTPADTTATSSLAVACSNGTPWTLTSAGTFSLTGSPTPDTISGTYTLTPTSGTGAGTASYETVTIDGLITAAAYTLKTPGIYTGSFTVDVNP